MGVRKEGKPPKQFLQRFVYNAAAKSIQSCSTLCNARDGSPLGSSVPGILQARILEWVAISSFRGSSIFGIKTLSIHLLMDTWFASFSWLL